MAKERVTWKKKDIYQDFQFHPSIYSRTPTPRKVAPTPKLKTPRKVLFPEKKNLLSAGDLLNRRRNIVLGPSLREKLDNTSGAQTC